MENMQIGWVSADVAAITEWKRALEERMAADPHAFGAMVPRFAHDPIALDLHGNIVGFAVSVRPNIVSELVAPQTLIPMLPWVASTLFSNMDR